MLVFLAIFATDAQAWEGRTDDLGQQLHWARHTIRFSVNPAGAHGLSQGAIDTLVSAATRGWTHPLSESLRFQHDGNTTIAQASHTDEVNVIYFEEAWSQDPELLAVTYIWSNTEGEIIGFDMALNAEHHEWSIDGTDDTNDLLNTLSHEFGHALGIDHSTLETLATMYPSSPPGETLKRDLHTDDVEAVTYLYANGVGAEAKAAGCSTSPATPAYAWLLFFPILALQRREESS
jgi:hypothetical protein